LNSAKIGRYVHSKNGEAKKNSHFVPKALVRLEKKIEKKTTEGVPPVVYAAQNQLK